MSWLFISLALGAIVFIAVARNQGRVSALRSATAELRVDGLGVRRELADGRSEAIDWDEITEVEVLTAKTGPYKDAGGVVILYGNETRGCLVPIDRVEPSGLLEHLQQLPGFDVARFADALQARPPTRTSCWAALPPPLG